MTNEELEQKRKETEEIENRLKEMSGLSEDKRKVRLPEIAIEYGVFYIPPDDGPNTYTLFKNIHIYLQSKLMSNACLFAAESSKSAEESSKIAERACSFAKWSCFWAAVAAIVSLGSIIVMLCSS